MTTAADAILRALAEGGTITARIMIVVAHPDDETIGIGAQLCRFRNSLLVQVTDGAPRDGRDAAAHGYPTICDYAAARRAELAAALEIGQAGGVRLELVGVTDQEACLNLVTLTRRIAGLLKTERPRVIFVQPYEGGHPDHDAASFSVHAACWLLEREENTAPPIIEMTAYHADGAGLATGVFLPAPARVLTLRLSTDERLRKRRMIDCFASQRELLAPFATEFECFREAPHYDFSRPAHPGELHYERLGWNITGALWRRHAEAALDALGIRAA